MQWNTAGEVSRGQTDATLRGGRGGRPDGPPVRPEDLVHVGGLGLPCARLVPHASHRLSGPEELVAESELSGEWRTAGVGAKGAGVQRRPPFLLHLEAPPPEPEAGTGGRESGPVPAANPEPVSKSPGGLEGLGGRSHPEKQGRRPGCRASPSPRAAPVKYGVLEGSPSVEEKEREARNGDMW